MNRQDVLIEADELLARLNDPTLRIYDASIAFFWQEGQPTIYEEYQRGHLPGAAFFDHEAFSIDGAKYSYTVLTEPALSQRIGEIGIDARSEVIFYADMLPSATRAWWILRAAGHNRVRILNGGLAAWRKVGGDVEQGARQYPAAHFTGRPRPHMWADKDEVQAALAGDPTCVVNTLNTEWYEQERIAGSSLQSALGLMHNMEAFLPDEALAVRLREEAQHPRIITYCGGGIAATVNAVAHLIAGNENVAVYDGSLYEWAGEGLPTAHGKPEAS